MRRPLRFLSHKLDLAQEQTSALAEILADLRTERAALDVELQRAQKRYADALKGESFDNEGAKRASEQVLSAHAHRQSAVTDALARLHQLLTPEQRTRLSAIVRTDPFLL